MTAAEPRRASGYAAPRPGLASVDPGDGWPAAVLASALDALSVGCILVDSERRVVFASRAASAILSRRDGLCISGGRLATAPTVDGSALIGALRIVARKGAVERCFSVDRTSGLLAYQLVAQAIPGASAGFISLWVTDPAAGARAAVDRLAETYCLTPAEADITAQIGQGHDLRQIAEQRRSRPETVRWQLKQIFEKTGVRRQIDLVRVTLSGCLSFLQPR